MQIYMKPTRNERADLVRRIQAERRRRGLSYAALAERAEVDPSQVSRICRGEFVTFGDSVVRICMVLELSQHELAGIPAVAAPVRGGKDAAWAKLERSMRRAWDETPAGADRLVRVISAVAKMSGR